jgi:D-3-phosphoglycerate dehydrogenase
MNSKKLKILVTPTSFKGGAALEKLKAFAGEVVANPYNRPLGEDELIPLVADCDGYIAGLDYITQKVIGKAENLKVISRYGAGVDRVDVAAAKAKNIVVCNTPGVNAKAVADLTIALILSLARKIPLLDRQTRTGDWPRSTGIELGGKTIGIFGLGAVGKAVAERAAGFSMRIMAYDPYINESYAASKGIIAADFDEVVKTADFLCLHLPLTEKTRHIFSEKVMKTMKRGAFIINTARGGLIDEEAAYALLTSGHLGGLGLDVFEAEPPKASPLFGLDNVVLTPHVASHTEEAAAGMAEMAVQNLIDVLSGKDCIYML